ncbi:two-component system response regulator [Croceicoccus sp. YJ47]|uniref:response regulator n=1 Tax=Croceicoccus sp. YJ47 TaxID=2798724 RepID=UPI0019237C99|nr:response regulator [Croceicoccus sp. YJ47]QQN74228.1 response regulator [Croceicoccus sp. YJ47]
MGAGEQTKILVVDDVPESALITKAMLTKGGFDHIDIARGGRDALRMCGIGDDGGTAAFAHSYALVVLDIRMPDIDGLEVCARMRLSRHTRRLPILMLTATNDAETLNQAFMAGADDFLTKPINDVRLLARIRTLLRMQRERERRALREEELQLQNAALKQGQISFSLIDPDTDLLRERAFDLVVSDCRRRDRPAAIALVRIVDFPGFVELHGQDSAEAMVRDVAGMLRTIPAPVGVMLTAYGPGMFMGIEPGASSPRALDHWGEQAARAIAERRIHHGNSIQSGHVALMIRTAWAKPGDLGPAADRIIHETKTMLVERQ